MLGIIVTGHGGFASGLQKNVKMLSGADVHAVDFEEGMTPEQLDEKLLPLIAACADCDYTLIVCDLMGGTPFNRAATLSVANPKIRVLSGANTPMVLDLAMRNVIGDEVKDVDALAEELMTSGRDGIGKFELAVVAEEPDEDEDGI